jgi:hypothetical protein
MAMSMSSMLASGGSDQTMSELDQLRPAGGEEQERNGLRVEGLIEEDGDRRRGDREERRGVYIARAAR